MRSALERATRGGVKARCRHGIDFENGHALQPNFFAGAGTGKYRKES